MSTISIFQHDHLFRLAAPSATAAPGWVKLRTYKLTHSVYTIRLLFRRALPYFAYFRVVDEATFEVHDNDQGPAVHLVHEAMRTATLLLPASFSKLPPGSASAFILSN